MPNSSIINVFAIIKNKYSLKMVIVYFVEYMAVKNALFLILFVVNPAYKACS